MSFSYTLNSLGDGGLNDIRMITGDSESSDFYLHDEEIAQIILDYSGMTTYLYQCLKMICVRIARRGKIRSERLSEDYTETYKAYCKLRDHYGKLAGMGNLYPFSSSISKDDKKVYEDDIDIVSPKFKKGIHNN